MNHRQSSPRRVALALIVCAASAAAAGRLAQRSANAATDSQPAARGSDRITQLRTERIELLRQAASGAQTQFEKGLVSVEEVQEAGLAVLEAELESSETSAQRIAIHQRIVDFLRTRENRSEAMWKAGMAMQLSHLKSKARRLKAEIDLEQARLVTPAPR